MFRFSKKNACMRIHTCTINYKLYSICIDKVCTHTHTHVYTYNYIYNYIYIIIYIQCNLYNLQVQYTLTLGACSSSDPYLKNMDPATEVQQWRIPSACRLRMRTSNPAGWWVNQWSFRWKHRGWTMKQREFPHQTSLVHWLVVTGTWLEHWFSMG